MAKDYFSDEIGSNKIDYFSSEISKKNINPTGRTSSPNDFLQQELAKQSINGAQAKFGFNLQQYLTQAQPALKLMLEHPETLMGKAISPDQLNKTISSDYADIYRRSGGGVLPGAKSSNIAGQMIPEIAGTMLDIGTRPSAVIAPKVAGEALKLAVNTPATRRFMQTQLPTLSKELLDKNPMAPVYKTIDGIQRDITRPLPMKPGKLVRQGQKLVNSIQETMDNLGGQYQKTLEPFYKNKVSNFGGINNADLESIGIDPNNATVETLWKTRWDLLKQVGNPWKKEELLKKTTLKEDQLTNIIDRLKAATLNNISKEARDNINKLDPIFTDAIQSGKGILRMAHNPETGKINTTRLVNVFKDKADEGSRELFKRFSYYDKRINEVSKAFNDYNRNEMLKKIAGVGVLGVGAEQFLRWRLRDAMSNVTGVNNGQ